MPDRRRLSAGAHDFTHDATSSDPLGGSGSVLTQAFAPGSFTIPTGRFVIFADRIEIGVDETVTIQGTGLLAVII